MQLLIKKESKYIYLFDIFLLIILSILPFVLITGPFLSDFIVVISSIVFVFLIFVKKEFFYLQNKLFIFFIIWCLYLILTSLFSDDAFFSLESSLFYFRFGFFSLSIWYMLNNSKFFIKFFFFSLFFSFIILFLDSFLQYFTGKNILNFPYDGDRISSFFGEEKILGSYFSRLFPILFAILFYINFSKKFTIIVMVLIFAVTDIIVYISGERTAFFYLILTSALIIILINKYKVLRMSTLLVSLIIIFFISIYNPSIKNRMIDKTIVQTNIFQDGIKIFSLQHQVIYKSSFKIFQDNKLFGIGTKMFRKICSNNKYIVRTDQDYSINGCQTSPHNYYLQLLTETGIFGAIPIILTFLYVMFVFIRQFMSLYIFRKASFTSDFQICLYIALFITLWPFAPTGNFFNNYISIFHFLPIGFLIFSYEKKNIKVNND